jgi:hypothetical protein
VYDYTSARETRAPDPVPQNAQCPACLSPLRSGAETVSVNGANVHSACAADGVYEQVPQPAASDEQAAA